MSLRRRPNIIVSVHWCGTANCQHMWIGRAGVFFSPAAVADNTDRATFLAVVIPSWGRIRGRAESSSAGAMSFVVVANLYLQPRSTHSRKAS